MKKVLSASAVLLVLAIVELPGLALPGAQDRDANQAVKDRFVGAWRLVSLEAPDWTGKFINLTLPGCLYSRATVTLQFR